MNDEEASLIREIFDLYTKRRMGSVAIARLLDERGERTKGGAHWRGNAIRVVLCNPVYVGKVFFRGETYPGQHPPLISMEQFESAAQLLDERGEEPAKRRSNMSDFLLSGLLICAKCDKHFVGTTATGNGGVYRYYMCYSRQRYGSKVCDQDSLPAEQLESSLIEHITNCLRDDAIIDASIEKAVAAKHVTTPRHKQELSRIQRGLRDLRRRIDRYLQAFETGAIDPTFCGDRLSELKDRQADLESRREELAAVAESKQDPPQLADVRDIATAFADRLQDRESRGSRGILQKLVEKILVESRSTIRPFVTLSLVRIKGSLKLTEMLDT